MKALTYQGIKDVKVKNVKDPTIEKEDDIIVKVTSTAICGSDLHLIHGMIPNTPKDYVLGHETMGIVEEVGKGVTKLKKGDRIIVPFPISCGHCWYCEHDLWSQCDNSNPNGEIGAIFGYSNTLGGYNGGQAEFLRVPYANVGPVIVPEELTDEDVLFLTDILPTSYWGVENSNVKHGDTAVILGCGPVGLLSQKWAAYMGAKRIIAVDHVDYRLKHAAKFNGVETVNLKDHDNVGEYIKEITNGGADVVVDCVGMDGKMTMVEKVETLLKLQGGSKSAIEIATQAVRKGGTVSLVGVYGARYNAFPLGDFFSRNITLKMGQCPVHSYIDPILNLIKENKFDAKDIITHRLSLDKAEYGYKIFDEKDDECIKVILKP
ncbi:zinc-binding dehydrogenase family protein [Clostridium argentinense CDC 2741]|uniref:Zinc-binding dehydrogenase family protein n=1 Tax=Clostridium argentinense CDC 2741 TaxID=1418104 RepID=A0A0C1QZ57_9CLOT|nr:zinc-dependent alcohol dehydrogenase [Clostridium argentinense]ARC86076.1 glutathione-dependent formaldehyde dehydrogenase [Clostridium argentinense]KIE46372.1 zinc-binding dehydrogenase family protein [Clostridium argentinense CDC 2741]NFF39017.1 glutathione-dependent formaldehyde dehydrogenase [Clostridium argentinense]NFP48809.1 glutathione-dependent formaldehyde dehydrogenase [Clostridium argentinense]NFP70923.1 glutathione-dependent formaldehyde dehydrogenase [Clostridium argentinense]